MAQFDRDRPASDLTAIELYDLLCQRVLHDPANPSWTPELVELHRHSLDRRLVVMPEHFYTPVFSPYTTKEAVWEGTFEAGATYDPGAQLALLERIHRFRDELAGFDVTPPVPDEAKLCRFYWRNTEFSHGDASVYYSLLRHLRPNRVIEVGGGFSTLLASHAAERNGNTRVLCIEPYPRSFLERGLPLVTLDRRLAQDVEMEVFDELCDGDILFIDSSHVVKTGSDVVHLFLRVLPLLKAGVWVHIHDVFLPFEFPRHWIEQRLYWNEQYLLAALISNSAKWEIRISNYYLQRTQSTEIYRFAIPEVGVAAGGGSFWLRAAS